MSAYLFGCARSAGSLSLRLAGRDIPVPQAFRHGEDIPLKVLLVYGTSEGQTYKIARFLAARMVQNGHRVLTADCSDASVLPDPGTFDAVLLAASVHAGRYQSAVIDFVRQNREAIRARRNAFLSISLSAAASEAADRAGLQRCVEQFERRTGWTPQRVHHAAGALRYSAYGLLTRWMMKRIARRRGGPTDTRRDYELTDWNDLAKFADEFTGPETPPVRAPTAA